MSVERSVMSYFSSLLMYQRQRLIERRAAASANGSGDLVTEFHVTYVTVTPVAERYREKLAVSLG